MTLSRLLLPLFLALFGLTACSSSTSSSDPKNSGLGGDGSSAASTDSGSPADVVGGAEGDARPPEFRAIRGAIQPITEFKPEAGQRMADACMRAEVAVPGEAADEVEKHLLTLIEILDESAMKELPERSRVGMLAAISKDIKALGGKAGAPKLKLVETKDKLCGKSGKCSEDAPGALCYRLAFSDGKASCACTSPKSVQAAKEAAAAASSEDEATEGTKPSAGDESGTTKDADPSATSTGPAKAGTASIEEKVSTEVTGALKEKSSKGDAESTKSKGKAKTTKSKSKKTSKPKSKASAKTKPAATTEPREKSSK